MSTTIDAQGNLHDRNGQFAGQQNSAPAGTLVTEPAISAGSFVFPPGEFATQDEYVDFFVNAPISDRVLSNADHAYKHWRTEQINEHVRVAYRTYGNDPRVVREAAKSPLVSDQKAQRFVDEKRREAEAMYPDRELPPNLLRGALIARQLAYYRDNVTDPNAGDILDRVLDLGRGDRPTVREIIEELNVTEWTSRALTDSDLASVDATYRIARILDRQEGIWDAVYGD